MKKIIQLCIICSVLLATACKKEASTMTELATIAQVEPQTDTETTGNATDGGEDKLDVAVKLTADLYTALEAGESIFVKEVAEGHYIGDAIATPQHVASNIPCNNIMDRFTIYLNNNKPSFLAWANANCKPYVGNYHDPCGKTILFMVTPTNPGCGPVQAPNPNCWTLLGNDSWTQNLLGQILCYTD
jgi:hypothetical protein